MKINFTLLLIFLIHSSISNAQTPDWRWAKSIGGYFADDGQSIAIDHDGNIYTTGMFTGTADFDPGPDTFNLVATNNYDIFISKLNGAGNFIWAKSIGRADGDYSYNIVIDAAVNFYITGKFEGTVDFDPDSGVQNLTSNGLSDIYFAKYDSAGVYIRSWNLGGTSVDYGYALAVDAACNLYATGVFSGTVDFDPGPGTANILGGSGGVFVMKSDSAGNLIFAKAFDGSSGDFGRSIEVDTAGDGAILTTGFFNGFSDFDPDTGTYYLSSPSQNAAFVSKLDSAGNFVWAKVFKGTQPVHGYDLAIDPGGRGDIFFTGTVDGIADFDPGIDTFNLVAHGTLEDFFIAKLDSAGNFLWAKSAGGNTNDIGQSIAIDPASNIYVLGSFSGQTDFDPGPGVYNLSPMGGFDIFLTKLDSSGNFFWAKKMGKYDLDYGQGVAVDAGFNVYVTGSFRGDSVAFDSFTLANSDPAGFYTETFIAKLDTVTITTGNTELENNDEGILLFPNPATEIFFISSHSSGEIFIIDIAGKEIYRNELIPGVSEVNIKSFETGIYFIGIQVDHYKVIKKLIIVN